MKKTRVKRSKNHNSINQHQFVNFDNRYLIFSDLDGTLLNKDSQLTKYSITVIKRLTMRGHLFCLTTARPKRNSIHFYNKLNLSTPLVNYNGSWIHIPNNDNFKPINFCIGVDVLYKIFTNKKILSLIDNVIFETYNGTFLLKSNKKSIPLKQLKKTLSKFNVYTTKKINFVQKDFSNLKFGAWSVLISLFDEKNANLVMNLVRDITHCVYIRQWSVKKIGSILEINSAFTNKALAMQYIADYYGIPYSRCYCFGDSENDKQILKFVENSYAVKNAEPIAKQAAKNIIKWTNNQDAVAKTLNNIFKLGIKYKNS